MSHGFSTHEQKILKTDLPATASVAQTLGFCTHSGRAREH